MPYRISSLHLQVSSISLHARKCEASKGICRDGFELITIAQIPESYVQIACQYHGCWHISYDIMYPMISTVCHRLTFIAQPSSLKQLKPLKPDINISNTQAPNMLPQCYTLGNLQACNRSGDGKAREGIRWYAGDWIAYERPEWGFSKWEFKRVGTLAE